MSKMTITCEAFRPFRKNSLCGFASILIAELGLRIKDVTIFEKNAKRWAGLPAKPQVRDGILVKTSDGKLEYFSILEFRSREISDAFSAAVIRAVLEFAPSAFHETAETSTAKAKPKELEDEIPF
jgi:hypothetical protein